MEKIIFKYEEIKTNHIKVIHCFKNMYSTTLLEVLIIFKLNFAGYSLKLLAAPKSKVTCVRTVSKTALAQSKSEHTQTLEAQFQWPETSTGAQADAN